MRSAVAFALLLVPTAAMGATTPALTRHLARGDDGGGRGFAWLYTVNTLGAALGCALAGFVLLGSLGLLRTALVAVGLDLAVAAAARALPARVEAPASAPAAGARLSREGAAVALLSGFAALLCESLWFRVISAFVKSSTYAFSLLRTVFLVGVVAGGARVTRSRSPEAPWRATARAFAALGAGVVLSVAVLGRLGTLSSWLGGASAGDADGAQLALAAAVLLVPTALMGAAWPRAVDAATRGLAPERVGAAVGAMSAWNTLGGAVGVLAGPAWLVPHLGVLRSFGLALACVGAAALVAARRDGSLTLRGDPGFAARVTGFSLLAFATIPGAYLQDAVSRFPKARVLEVREGRDGTAAVLHYDRASVCAASRNRCEGRCRGEFSWRQLIFGTVSYASTIPPARRYMRALAHLPMLHRPEATRALLICFGTGTTAAAFAAHPELRSLTIVDINPDVFELARHFEASNRAVLRDPRVSAVVEDGRHYLATSEARFDVISLEPPPPTADGAAPLYTQEFYSAAKERLSEGGVVAQWIPLDQQAGSLNRAMLAAMTTRFRHVALWIPARNEGVVLASDAPLRPDPWLWRGRWRGLVRSELAEAGFASPAALSGARVLDDQGVRRYVGRAAPMRDDLPGVSFYRSARDPIFRVGDLWPYAVAAEGSYSEAERLGMRAWDLALQGDRSGAQALVARARGLVPRDPWWDYLGALEYGCLDLDDP
ncbi:MAG: fused MFS/spermidine synthase [Polyangiales bacterium]